MKLNINRYKISEMQIFKQAVLISQNSNVQNSKTCQTYLRTPESTSRQGHDA